MSSSLEGVRVLDFGRVIASAVCGTLLADMGAEVIKIERPGGEFDRNLGPFAPDGRAIPYELIVPRNKKSITLNTRLSKGKEILDKLVQKAQIIITGFTPKGNQIMNLSYERLKEINPAIIQVAITGYGYEGPYANRPAFDSIAQAESGAMSFSGFPDNPPTRSNVPYVDFSTSMLGALGAVSALRHQERTGLGQLVDVSLLRTASFMVAGMGTMAEYTLNNNVREPIGNNSFYTYADAFQARDGWVMINVIGNEIWQRFLKLIDRTEWLADERFQNDYSRYTNRHMIAPVIQKWVSQYNLNEVVRLLNENRIPCGRINTAREVVDDMVFKDSEMLIDMDYPGLGKVPMPGLPIRFSASPGEIKGNAPGLGEHNKEIYCELLKYSQGEYEELVGEGLL